MKQISQTQINQYPKIDRIDNSLENLNYKLSLCGKLAHKKYYCKQCELEHNGRELLKESFAKFHCEIRYCSCPDCLVYRFVRQMETFQDIKRFNNLNSLWHFTISFPAVSEVSFKKDFSKIKKRFEYVLNKYFEKLRLDYKYMKDSRGKWIKEGKKRKRFLVNPVLIQAVRVLDFSFVTEGQVMIHYHFGSLPVGGKNIRSTMLRMQEVRKEMNEHMRIKSSVFHFESYGLKQRDSVLSYLSIRASCMYKYDVTSNFDYKFTNGKLRSSIQNNKYIFLSSVLTKREYLKSFYNKVAFVCIGWLPRPPRHGSILTDDIPQECSIHGHLDRKDIRIEVTFDDLFTEVVPPPDFSTNIDNIEYVYITCKEVFSDEKQKDS